MIAERTKDINLGTYKGEIKLTRRNQTYIFRGVTVGQQRLIEEQRKKDKWKKIAVLEGDRVALLPHMRKDHEFGAPYTRFYAAKVDLLNKLDRLDQLGVQMTVITRCERCGKILEDPESLKRGMGPTCWNAR